MPETFNPYIYNRNPLLQVDYRNYGRVRDDGTLQSEPLFFNQTLGDPQSYQPSFSETTTRRELPGVGEVPSLADSLLPAATQLGLGYVQSNIPEFAAANPNASILEQIKGGFTQTADDIYNLPTTISDSVSDFGTSLSEFGTDVGNFIDAPVETISNFFQGDAPSAFSYDVGPSIGDIGWAPELSSKLTTPTLDAYAVSPLNSLGGSASGAAGIDSSGSFAGSSGVGDLGVSSATGPAGLEAGADWSGGTAAAPSGAMPGWAASGLFSGATSFGLDMLFTDKSAGQAVAGGIDTGVGTAVGTALGGPIGGFVGGTIGKAVGSILPGRVICTELYEQGLLSRQDYLAEQIYTLRKIHPYTVRGYHLWAVPYVTVMRKSRALSLFTATWAGARAKEIAHRSGYRAKSNGWGRLVRVIMEPVCFVLGALAAALDLEKPEFADVRT